jgi:hypothetical protein
MVLKSEHLHLQFNNITSGTSIIIGLSCHGTELWHIKAYDWSSYVMDQDDWMHVFKEKTQY